MQLGISGSSLFEYSSLCLSHYMVIYFLKGISECVMRVSGLSVFSVCETVNGASLVRRKTLRAAQDEGSAGNE